MNTTNTKIPAEKGHEDDVSLGIPVENDTLEQNLAQLEDASNTSVYSPDLRGSHSTLGSESSTELKRNALEMAHAMGIAPKANSSTVKPLNLAQDVADAEKYRRTH